MSAPAAESPRFPVSVKGVVAHDGRVVLVKNERDEWELPGGRLEPDETPTDCVVREIAEELGLAVTAGVLLDCWVYQPVPGRKVLIVTYGCRLATPPVPRLSAEHRAFGWFDGAALADLALPAGYRPAIRRWLDGPA
ncbi:MAG: NUDIX hydrolase [Proteobacteria bacterium]|nr:NUDIX hydrolase [Pseudomonadota bacterium]